MTSNRVYIGRIPYRVNEKDIERFFKGIGRIRDIMLKTGYCFVEFDDQRDAADAIYECNGQMLLGERVSVEAAKGTPHGEDLKKDEERGIEYPTQRRRDFERQRGDYRLLVENLSTRISWQELKEMMRKAGDVAFADAHRERRNEGVVEFVSRSGVERALERFDGVELNGRKIKLVDISPNIKKRSRCSSRGRRRESSGSSSSEEGSDEEWRSNRKRKRSDSDDSEGAYDSEKEDRKKNIQNGHDKKIDDDDKRRGSGGKDDNNDGDTNSEGRRDKRNGDKGDKGGNGDDCENGDNSDKDDQ